jgi:hypothetical protein
MAPTLSNVKKTLLFNGFLVIILFNKASGIFLGLAPISGKKLETRAAFLLCFLIYNMQKHRKEIML